MARTKLNQQTPSMVPGTYDGVVVSNLLPNGLIQVRIQGLGMPVNCVWCAGIFSGLLGFNVSYTPPKKTKVLVLYTGKEPSYIVASIPGEIGDETDPVRFQQGPNSPNYHNSQIFAKDRKKTDSTFNAHKPPADLAEGELMIDNLRGVALGLLRNLSYLSAGDLARVECHLLDDMVRVISRTFKHYSAFGDYRIINDGGRLNVVWNGTSHEFEADGLRRKKDPRAKLDKSREKVSMDDDGANDDGRWRFSQYVGWLGNFVNMFVTDPVDNLGKLAEGQFRSGKARVHINNDGSVLVQSVSDIVLEKVVRIPVPIQLRHEEDPQGNRSDETLSGDRFLKTWKPSEDDNVFEMVYQLRDYARWLNNAYSLGRFRQMDRDYSVPTEAQTPKPQINNSFESDKKKANTVDKKEPNNWREVYAAFRIYRDGSVQQIDAYGNCITMTKTGIQISSPKDIFLQAGGSFNVMAGRDINLVARKNVNISALTEKLRLSAKTGMQSIVTLGNWLVETVGSKVAYFKTAVNFNNNVAIAKGGALDVGGPLRARQVYAAKTHSVDGHNQHIFPGVPKAPATVDDTFEFQSKDSYKAEPLYETLTQQMMDDGEIKSDATWNLADTHNGPQGAPWPGEGAKHKAFRGAEPLSKPSSKVPGHQSTKLDEVPIRLKYQL